MSIPLDIICLAISMKSKLILRLYCIAKTYFFLTRLSPSSSIKFLAPSLQVNCQYAIPIILTFRFYQSLEFSLLF